jgi:hypothetical protein
LVLTIIFLDFFCETESRQVSSTNSSNGGLIMEEKKPRGRPRNDGKPAGTVPRLKPKGQLGGAREGAGRPAGSKNIHSHSAVKKLEELGFDPIEMMVQQYNQIHKVLTNGEVRVGSGAYAQLLATQGTLINNLMQYGYKKVPEKIEQEITEKRPVAIKLNLKPKEKVA